MSVNRENIVWQSEDGTWSRGFLAFYDVGADEEGWDYEWGVEYDHSEFCWVSTDHPSENAAKESWRGSNPGGAHDVPYTPENAEQCARYEQMATKLKSERQQGYDGAWGHVG